MQKQGLTFDFSRPLPVSEDQHFNHLPLSFTLAFYHVIMWKHILQSWSLSETTGAMESLQLLRIHWGFLNSPAAVQSTDVPSVDLGN